MSDITQSLFHRYRSYLDCELLALAAHRNDLTSDAQVLLDQEMSRRQLSTADIALLDESDPAPEEEPLPEIEPQELPEDFFTEDKDEGTDATSVASRRPAGIHLIAFVCWLSAFWSIWLATIAAMMEAGLSSALNLIIGVVELIVGVGLFRMRNWALQASILLFTVNGITAGLLIIVAGIAVLRGAEPTPGRSIWMFVNLIYSAIILKYLLSQKAMKSQNWC